MRIENQTPFEAAYHVINNKNGEDLIFIGVKASYDINACGVLTISNEQIPVTMTDHYFGKPGFSSLRIASDYSFDKSNTDIILIGHAYTTKHSDRESYVYLKTNGLSYLVKVFGNRHWKKRLGFYRISSPEPFKKIPLVFEHVFGGYDTSEKEPDKMIWDMRNPVGCGFYIKNSSFSYEKRPLPNFENPNLFIQRIYDKPEPYGFGFVAPSWTARSQFAGTYDKKWEKEQRPKLPEDFDPKFFNVAQPGLIYPGVMKGDEPFTLTGVSEKGTIRFSLPGVKPQCILKKYQNYIASFSLNLDRVLINSDENKVLLLWSKTYQPDEDIQEIDHIQCSL